MQLLLISTSFILPQRALKSEQVFSERGSSVTRRAGCTMAAPRFVLGRRALGVGEEPQHSYEPPRSATVVRGEPGFAAQDHLPAEQCLPNHVSRCFPPPLRAEPPTSKVWCETPPVRWYDAGQKRSDRRVAEHGSRRRSGLRRRQSEAQSAR